VSNIVLRVNARAVAKQVAARNLIVGNVRCVPWLAIREDGALSCVFLFLLSRGPIILLCSGSSRMRVCGLQFCAGNYITKRGNLY
jgi:hypothetical protein